MLQSEEVLEAVKEWYAARGEKVPPKDMLACMEMIQKEKKEMKAWEEEMKNPTPVEHKPEKAAYGTPEFWKQYWAKKRAAGYVTKKDSRKAEKK